MLNLENFDDHIEEALRRAEKEGKFDNLPNRGKPLKLDNVSGEQRTDALLKDVLKENNFVPDWIELQQKIGRTHAQLVRRVRNTRDWANDALAVLAGRDDLAAIEERNLIHHESERARHRFAADVQAINEDIAELNLKAPHPRFHRMLLDAARELARLDFS